MPMIRIPRSALRTLVVAIAGAVLSVGGLTLTAWAQDEIETCTDEATVDLMPGPYQGEVKDWTVGAVRMSGLNGCVGEPLRLRLLGGEDAILFEVVTEVSGGVMVVPVTDPVAVAPVQAVTLDLVGPAPAPTPTLSPPDNTDVGGSETVSPSPQPSVAVSPAEVERPSPRPAPAGTSLPRTGATILGLMATAAGLVLIGLAVLGSVRRRRGAY